MARTQQTWPIILKLRDWEAKHQYRMNRIESLYPDDPVYEKERRYAESAMRGIGLIWPGKPNDRRRDWPKCVEAIGLNVEILAGKSTKKVAGGAPSYKPLAASSCNAPTDSLSNVSSDSLPNSILFPDSMVPPGSFSNEHVVEKIAYADVMLSLGHTIEKLAPPTRHSQEQILAKLTFVQLMLSLGHRLESVLGRLNIPEDTYRRWRFENNIHTKRRIKEVERRVSELQRFRT